MINASDDIDRQIEDMFYGKRRGYPTIDDTLKTLMDMGDQFLCVDENGFYRHYYMSAGQECLALLEAAGYVIHLGGDLYKKPNRKR